MSTIDDHENIQNPDLESSHLPEDPPAFLIPGTTSAVAVEHDTLKYSLLGPSLTKAGQDSVDQQKVSEIIYNASKGSKFFNNEEVRDRNLTERINKILAHKRQLERVDLASDLRRADTYIAELELSRDLTQTVVHIDCDAFYAAVEELDRPELRDVPMAVGQGVLTTCNYHARKFGCRSGMARFVAMKLCPHLICLPLNFDKYTSKAEEVRAVLAIYDPRFESASIDEAYLNITEYCKQHRMGPDEVVFQLRAEVHEKTKITVSAGIAPNAKLAKIASNRNKPNGQFKIASERATIMEFMKNLPTRKVNGIGRVFERELDAIGVKTCGDIYAHRAYLSKLFGEKAFQFLMQCYLGLGRTKIQPAEEYERKSVGTESTFREMSGKTELREKLRHIAEELEKDLERTQYKGRTLVLKIKLHTYEVLTRQTSPPKAIYSADDLYKYSLPILSKLEKELPNMKLRLMGLRVTHIVSTKKGGIDFFGLNRRVDMPGGRPPLPKTGNTAKADDGEWEVWPEAEFEQAARQEREDEMNELEALSQELQEQKVPDTAIVSAEMVSRPLRKALSPTRGEFIEETEELWDCPICLFPQIAEDRSFNAHVDFCLSRQTIKDAVKSTSSPQTPTQSLPRTQPSKLIPTKRKRGRPRGENVSLESRVTKRKSFFS
ncbi:DNA-directed polymeras-like protein kappa [Lepidopterella palustris CBS 459.81]|uniref:DNA polymerase kappa n=1 Tax=Lepidopterella palustris CBS 459.81 TaxID=1314670 RepID=A0A8E2E631_9PEZI|nr:DNA-directed polymeras-like protein kappa [Lepidopterella palustris CBS 459.81]